MFSTVCLESGMDQSWKMDPGGMMMMMSFLKSELNNPLYDSQAFGHVFLKSTLHSS
jgi:hypothetical protein